MFMILARDLFGCFENQLRAVIFGYIRKIAVFFPIVQTIAYQKQIGHGKAAIVNF